MTASVHAAFASDSYTGIPSRLSRTNRSLDTAEITGLDREALFAQFSPLVNRLVRQYGKTPDMRQDLLGELYCLFHSFLEQFEPARGVPLPAYLVRQLTAGAFTFARKQWQSSERDVRLHEENQANVAFSNPDPTPNWDDAMQQRQVTERLPELIQSLPLRQKQVLILRYYEERSFAEIAQMLEIQPSSVRSLLRYALKRMREQVASD